MKRTFNLDFLLVDDDPSLNQLVRASLSTRKLRRLYESAISGYFGGMVETRARTHFADSAQEGRQLWQKIAQRNENEAKGSTDTTDSGRFAGYCTIAFLDFDMPGENGLELAESLSDAFMETILFTGRQPQMEAFLSDRGKTLEDYGIDHLMLKGAPAREFNEAILALLKARLDTIGEQT